MKNKIKINSNLKTGDLVYTVGEGIKNKLLKSFHALKYERLIDYEIINQKINILAFKTFLSCDIHTGCIDPKNHFKQQSFFGLCGNKSCLQYKIKFNTIGIVMDYIYVSNRFNKKQRFYKLLISNDSSVTSIYFPSFDLLPLKQKNYELKIYIDKTKYDNRNE